MIHHLTDERGLGGLAGLGGLGGLMLVLYSAWVTSSARMIVPVRMPPARTS